MLYVFTEKGEVNLVNPKPEGVQIASSFKATKGTKEFFTYPVIHYGVLYIRHGEALRPMRSEKIVRECSHVRQLKLTAKDILAMINIIFYPKHYLLPFPARSRRGL